MGDGFESRHLRNTKMGDISEGVASKKYGEKKIRVIFCHRKKCLKQRSILRPLGSYFVTFEKNWQPKTFRNLVNLNMSVVLASKKKDFFKVRKY